MTPTRRGALLAALVLVAGACALLSPALFSGKVLSAGDKQYFQSPLVAEKPAGLARPSNGDLADAVDVFHPHLLEAREAIRAGELPAWNEHIEAGRPIGAQNGGPFFPLNWLAYVLPFWQSLEWIALLKLLVAGSGTFVLARHLGLGAGGSLFAAVSFAFGVPFVVSLEHPQAVVYGLLPWLLAAADWMVRGGGGARAVLACGGVAGLAELSGHPESMLVMAVAFLAFSAYTAFAQTDGPVGARARRLVGQVVAVGAVACAVGAVTLIPTLLILRDSVDSAREAPPLALRTLLAAFYPEAWGRPDKVSLPGPAGTSYAYRAMYIGAAPLVLALGGLVARRSRTQMFFAGTAVVCGLLLLDLPVIPDVVNALPVLSLVNEWHFIFLAVFCGSVLAGIGLDIALRGTRAERRRLVLGAAAAAALPLLAAAWATGALGAWGSLGESFPVLGDSVDTPDTARLAAGVHWAVFAGLAVLLAAAAWRRPRFATATALAAAAAVLALADLVPLGAGYHPAVDQARADPPPSRAIRFLQAHAGSSRVAGFGPALYPNAVERYGLEDARGEDLPERNRFGSIWTGLGGDFFQDFGLKVITEPGAGRTDELLDLMAVRYIVDGGPPGPVPGGLRRTAIDEPGQRVLENRDPFPRAWVAYDVRPARDEDAALARTLRSGRRGLLRSPVVEPGDEDGLPAGPPRGVTPARVVQARRGRMEVQVAARRAGVLVLADSWDPGWRASVDGRSAAVRPANGAFRAVPVPAGRHKVELAYRPMPLLAGAVTSLLALLTVVGGIAVLTLRR